MTIYRFDQIAELITSRVTPGDTLLDRYVGLEHLDPESLKLRRWGTPSDVIGEKLHFWPGDIIYAKRRAYQRKLAVAEFEGICSAHAMVLRARPDVCLPELLPFFMQSEIFNQRAVEISVGSLSPTINWSALARQEFPLPPIDEQHCIADLLWAAEESRMAIDDIKEKSEKVFAALVDKLVVSGTTKEQNQSELQQTGFGFIPSYWSVNALIDFAEKEKNSFVNGPFGSDLLTSELQETGVPVIYVRDIKPNRYIRVSTVHVAEKKAEQLVSCQVHYGDVLIAKVGDPPGFATPYFEHSESIVTQDVIRIRPSKDVNPIYLACLLNSTAGKRAIQNIKISGTRERFPLTQFKRIKLPKPPLNDQNRMADVFSGFISSIVSTEAHFTSLKELKKQILTRFLCNE